MVRSTARLLVVVMLLASGRLLACGWECIDERPAAAEAACHQESAPVTALTGDAAHACLPEVVEPRVTVAKPVAGKMFASASPLPAFVTHVGTGRMWRHRGIPFARPYQPPHPALSAVLRI